MIRWVFGVIPLEEKVREFCPWEDSKPNIWWTEGETIPVISVVPQIFLTLSLQDTWQDYRDFKLSMATWMALAKDACAGVQCVTSRWMLRASEWFAACTSPSQDSNEKQASRWSLLQPKSTVKWNSPADPRWMRNKLPWGKPLRWQGCLLGQQGPAFPDWY